jgi:hypothetical protein
MMPASTTLASSQPRWGDQKAPITAAPKTSQNPFRHLVGRGAPCVSASSKAPAGHAAVGGSRPAFIGHRNYPFVVVRRYRVQARPEDGGDEQGFGAKQQQGRTRRGARRSAIFRGACAPGSRPHRVSEGGGDEQMFGAKQQVPHAGGSDKEAESAIDGANLCILETSYEAHSTGGGCCSGGNGRTS